MAWLPAHSGQGFEEETPPLSVLRPTETHGSCLGAGWDGWGVAVQPRGRKSPGL